MANSAAQRIMELFAGYEGAHGTHGVPVFDPENGKWAIRSTAESIHSPPTLAMWESHLAGKRPLGVVPIRADFTCLWGSIDVDEYDINALEMVQRIEAQKLPLIPCRSKSGGMHLFIFLKAPVPATTLQAILRDLAAQLGVAGSEIFPKQTKILIEKGDVGSWMVMPYYGDTFGGKLKEQVGLRKSGAEMSLDEFIKAAEKARIDEAELEELGRRRTTRGRAAAAGKAAAGQSSAGPFGDGPPCLQHLASEGIGRGGQSNALLMMGIYYKRAFPEEWKERLQTANQEYLKPPGSADGLASVIRSLEKKDYEYTCKTEPMASHCNSSMCRLRRFGVGDGGNFPIIQGMSKLNTEPPIWFLDIGSERIEATTEQLQNYMLFHRLCMDKLNQCFGIMKPGEWLNVLNNAMQSMELLTAPPEVSVKGRFLELLEEFLTNRAAGRVKDDILSGRPWLDEETKRHYFRLSDLQKFLVRENFKDMSRGQLTQRIRDLGGQTHGLSIKTRFVSCWWVSAAAVVQMPELDAPPRPQSPI